MTTQPLSSSIVIFTDGACTGNPGPGGWASIVALPAGAIHELGGGNPDTTNNRMEMAAAIRALAMLEEPVGCGIVLYTDSTYLIKGITQWIWGWRSRGWKSAEGKDVANKDLWEELLRQVTRLKPAIIDWRYVKGHAGYPGNERCDEIAVSFAKSKPEQLYVGPRDGYFVDLDDLPPPQDLSAGSSSGSSTSKSSGLSSRSSGSIGGSRGTSSGSGSSKSGSGGGTPTYLSYYGGILKRHYTWSDCEKTVKGRNAKFKKVKSPQEERDTLRAWGLDPQTSIT